MLKALQKKGRKLLTSVCFTFIYLYALTFLFSATHFLQARLFLYRREIRTNVKQNTQSMNATLQNNADWFIPLDQQNAPELNLTHFIYIC